MTKIIQKMHISDEEAEQIRKVWDEKGHEWQFSITDVVALLTESVDARNYWKALKNRLKNTHKQLVMDCNQLKMKANDGKFYMVDTASTDTIQKIIQIIAPYNVPAFRAWFEHIETKNSHTSNLTSLSPISTETEISTALLPLTDIYENKKEIILKLMLPGVDIDKIIISTNIDKLTIKAVRNNSVNVAEENYLISELQWGEFYRIIDLPRLIDVDNISATFFHGLITVTLTKLDPEKTRYIKIKSLC